MQPFFNYFNLLDLQRLTKGIKTDVVVFQKHILFPNFF